ncbi:hypothetical protein C8Q80DRAFT_1358567 [Daedaleopsis nitida]|nr:hypothetical protein C8Q80DRAFT_1358567 [Daedaleopsis nitida]
MAASFLNTTANAITPHNVTQEHLLRQIVDLEGQLNTVLRQQLRLKSLWNTTVIIHRMPIEILSDIFYAVKDSLQVPRHGALSNTEWVHVRLVCRYWCKVADATPALWRTVDILDRVDWVYLSLSRSAPLTIDLSFRNCDILQSQPDIEWILQHSRRIRTLKFWSFMDGCWPCIAPLFQGDTMHALESLRYVCNGTASAVEDSYHDLKISFDRHYPRLRSLQLAYTTIPCDPLLYGQLRSLNLTSCSFSNMRYKTFLDLLMEAKNLQDLRLCGCLDHLARDVQVNYRISLPRLMSLTLEEHAPEHCAAFLTHIALPSIVSIDVEVDKLDEDAEEDLSHTLMLPRLLPDSPTECFPFWKHICEASLSMYEGVAPYDLRLETPHRPNLPQQKVTLELIRPWGMSVPDGLQDIVKICRGTSLTKLTVWVSHDMPSAPDWRRVFNAFPLLEFLEVGAMGDAAQVWYALRTDVPTPPTAEGMSVDAPQPNSDEGGYTAVVCPRLHTVHLDGCLIGHGSSLLQDIIRCLRDRVDKGAVWLKTLHIALYHETEQSYEDLKAVYLPTLESLVEEVEYCLEW